MQDNYLTTAEVAAKAGLRPQQISYRAMRLGLTPTKRGIALWSPEQVAQLIQVPKRGRPKEQRKEQE